MNIINWYGQQEGRSSKAEIEQTWSNINAELAKIELRGEHAILMGDMNRHVGVIIEGNNDKVSAGGKLIIDLINTKKYVLVNSTNKVTGGPFTWYSPGDPRSKSCVDLVIVSKGLFKHFDKLIIDKGRN